jgi:hypothetical protein
MCEGRTKVLPYSGQVYESRTKVLPYSGQVWGSRGRCGAGL